MLLPKKTSWNSFITLILFHNPKKQQSRSISLLPIFLSNPILPTLASSKPLSTRFGLHILPRTPVRPSESVLSLPGQNAPSPKQPKIVLYDDPFGGS